RSGLYSTWRSAELDGPCPLDRGRKAARQRADAEARIEEPNVIPELSIVQADGASNHVLELRKRDEAGAPIRGDLRGRHTPEARVVRNHEMAADALAEVKAAELREVVRRRFVAREVRLEKAVQTLVRDRWRKSERVRLEWVARVDAIRPDERSALELE